MEIMISVVVPTYKRPHLLARCLQAIIDQSFSKKNVEIIIVSDGPDEGASSVVEKIKQQDSFYEIHFLTLPLKKGPAAARNMGWRSARGKLIVFTDDDCIPSKTWLENFWNAFLDYGNKKIVFTGKVHVPISEKPTDHEKNISLLESASFITANCACEIAALEQVGGFDEEFSLAWREDSALEFKLLDCHIPIIKVEAATLEHPVRPADWGVSLKEQKKGMFNALLYKKFPDHYKNRIASQPLWNYYIMVISSILSIIYVFADRPYIGMYFFMIWMLFIFEFVARRLKGTSHSFSHITEMIITSICIPFVSIYWTILGAIRFKVFHL